MKDFYSIKNVLSIIFLPHRTTLSYQLILAGWILR
jgi:hypothetical protein